MLLSGNRYQPRSSAATSDGQMDHGQVRKPRISRQKPVTWPDRAFGHLTGYAFVGRTGSNLPRPGALAGGTWVATGTPLSFITWSLNNQAEFPGIRRGSQTKIVKKLRK